MHHTYKNTDTGFYLELDGKKFKFPQAERAPPEVYMSCGYEAYVLHSK